MNKKLNHIIVLLILIFIGCKSTVPPIVYDQSYSNLKNEIEIITLLINQNDFNNAQKRINQNLSVYNNDLQLLTLSIHLLTKEGKYSEALNNAENLLLKNKSNPLLYALLATIYYHNGDIEKAHNYIKLSLSISKNISYTWYQKGFFEYNEKNYNASEISFNRAYLLDKNNTDAYFFRYLSRLYIQQNIDELKKEWNFIKENIILSSAHYVYHAIVLYEIKSIKDAEEIINEGFSLFPDDPFILNCIAYLITINYSNTQEKDDLLLTDALDKILKSLSYTILPEFADTHLQILYLQKNYTELENNYNKYKLLFPENQIIQEWNIKIKPE
ncbi:MAG: hypothetical protein A2015_06825 [Spirochaetes bacterium GWF1_31_7]|nr:MAG: hypothetical protein A2Y30_09635 [Spirochaetes bacterium GWE1_32_154]OHD46545.1 MAG: hypothetical protein A2015_06825 [Spirochaetes bacterium GWF1_31_7]OHD49354.1 MAG: hypothetical protein A2Y29_03820 [Spirochaetes bacterium GWE2_31_10]HBD93093.1 hypothetical protein [Spirochaetia bacterium]HBI36790.1 hypothetical protein [Spirochaetia bacterium]